MVDKEFDETLRKIQSYGYGLVFIAHAKVKSDSDGTMSVTRISPDLPERCAKIINRMVDLTAYLGEEEGGKRYIYPRQITLDKGLTKVEIYAGSHFAYLDSKMDLSYDALVKAIGDAMEKQAKEKGAKLTDKPIEAAAEPPKLDYDKIKKEIATIARKLKELDDNSENPHLMDEYRNIVATYLGKNKLVKECDATQVEHLNLILQDLQEFAKQNNI